MKTSFLAVIFSLLSFTLLAQDIEVSGKVVESRSENPIEFATVKLLDKTTGEMIAGTTTQPDGGILLNTTSNNFKVEISFMGFLTKEISDFDLSGSKVELGIILLEEDTKILNEVVVQGERSTTEFQLDKRVFNVGQDLSSTGASALEVLNNVPSVTVNIEGDILLRGTAGVQILINGKPSVLTSDGGNALGTITADMIEKVEVITNPSAKYNAEGTSGIINIVLKKEEKRGVNGSVTVNTGAPNNHSLGFSLNKRTERFNLFTQLGVGYRTFPEDNESINRDFTNQTELGSIGDSEKNETFFNLILGTDFYINDKNVVTLSGNYAFEGETEFSNLDFTRTNSLGNPVAGWNRGESTEATNPKWQYEFQYKSDFGDQEDHFFLFSAMGSSFAKEQSSEFINTPTLGEGSPNESQLTDSDLAQVEYNFQADYTRPISDEITLEVGSQYQINENENDFTTSNLEDGEYVVVPELSNDFLFRQKVLGVYSTFAYEGDKFGVKGGLRLENTDVFTQLRDTGEENDRNFTNLFPTLHTSYKLKDNFSIQAGYSRRINRPRSWSLNPFVNLRNPFNARTGNPDLLPEYTDSYEFTGIWDHSLFSVSTSVYHRYITQVVERVTISENNVNITMPMNIGTNNVTGFEMNAKVIPVDFWSLSADFNYNYFDRKGTYESTPFDFTTNQWSGRLTNKFDLPADFTLEVIGDYRSQYETFQRINRGYATADIGVRKKIMKGKAIVNFSVRDVFASRVFETDVMGDDFSQYDYRLRGRFVTFGFSYGFGKGEAMEFSSRKRR